MTDFSVSGHPGRWAGVNVVSGSAMIYNATGSGYGASGLILSKEIPATGSVLLSSGGSINLRDLTAGELYELSVERLNITGSAYLLYKNNYAS